MSGEEPSAPTAPSEPSAPTVSNGDSSDVIDIELLIAEVKKRPHLYRRPKGKGSLYKIDWFEISSTVFKPIWDKSCQKTKTEKIRVLQRKWHKIRESFLKGLGGVKKLSESAKEKRELRNQSLSFLLDTAVDSDVDMDANELPTNNNEEPGYSGTGNPPPSPELPQANMADAIPTPSTSEQVADFAKSHDFIKKPFYIPIPQYERPIVEPTNENLHFALMLVPLLNRLSSEQRYEVWGAILKVLRDAELPKKISILQNELKYQETVQGPSNLIQHFAAQAPNLHHYPPEVALPLIQQMPVMPESIPEMPEIPELPPASHGRPTNEQGEIIYPETDQEDLDDV